MTFQTILTLLFKNLSSRSSYLVFCPLEHEHNIKPYTNRKKIDARECHKGRNLISTQHLSQAGKFSYGIRMRMSAHCNRMNLPTANTNVMYKLQMLNLLIVSPRRPSAHEQSSINDMQVTIISPTSHTVSTCAIITSKGVHTRLSKCYWNPPALVFNDLKNRTSE